MNAYNQADAALPPAGDGFGPFYTATQVPFTVELIDGLVDIAVLDRGPGNPRENSAIKGFAILGRGWLSRCPKCSRSVGRCA